MIRTSLIVLAFALGLAACQKTPDPPSSIPQVNPGWHEVLTAPGVRISGAHPFMDPGGYRAHMIFELSQSLYKVPALYNSLLHHYQVNGAYP